VHREGHVGAALALYAPVGFPAFVSGFRSLAVLGAIGAVALAMLPDQDMRIPLVSHRGITHTLWFAPSSRASSAWPASISAASRG
jgi:inner membrane protein